MADRSPTTGATSTRSPALIADGKHLFTDVLSTIGATLGVALAVLTGWMVLDPLMRDRIAIASEKSEASADAMQTLAGIAFWATVSEEVDARIREQIKTGAFPVRLKSADWNSGNIVWLLDVIAPSQKLATNVLLNFRKVLKDQSDVRIHPVVARQIDPELLKKLTAGSNAAQSAAGAGKA